MVRVICPLFKKKKKQKNLLYLTFFTQSPPSANIDQSAPNLVKIYIYVQQNLNEFNHGSDWTGTTVVICS